MSPEWLALIVKYIPFIEKILEYLKRRFQRKPDTQEHILQKENADLKTKLDVSQAKLDVSQAKIDIRHYAK